MGVAGAGTMGSGIALAAAQKGIQVVLFDTFPAVIEKAKISINKNLDFLESRMKISSSERTEIFSAILFTSTFSDCKGEVVVEAIIEDLEAKAVLFGQLAAVNDSTCILASNTSSLSISGLQKHISHPGRFAGLHFFNPAQVMKLVEVVKGNKTSVSTIDFLLELCNQLGKQPVVCNDSPGFIVNRVARHYYLEAMRLVEEGIATYENVDDIMEATGFRMGPFRLMDLIGMDINLAVSESLYEALLQPARLKPSQLQIDKVSQGHLGRKSAKGFYNYPPESLKS